MRIFNCISTMCLVSSLGISAQEEPAVYYQPTSNYRVYEVEPVLIGYTDTPVFQSEPVWIDDGGAQPPPPPPPQPVTYSRQPVQPRPSVQPVPVFQEQQNTCCQPCCLPKVYLEGSYTFGDLITVDEDYAGARLFIEAPEECCIRPYLDLNGYRFRKEKHWAASGGLGFSADLGCCYWGLVNVFYDYRQGCFGPFNQIGVGLAIGNPFWTLRVNGYHPFKDHRSGKLHRFDFGDGFVATCRHREYAYTGVDGELEFTLWRNCYFDLYLGMGGYYYKNDKADDFGGGLARVGMSLFDYLTLECRTSYDNVFHSRVQGMVSLDIPLDLLFSCGNGDPCCRDNCWDIARSYRRNNIVQVKDCCQWTWNWSDESSSHSSHSSDSSHRSHSSHSSHHRSHH